MVLNTHHHKKSKSGKTRSRFSIRSEEVQIFKIYIYLNRYIKTLDQLYLEETYRDEQKRPKTHFFCLSSFLFLRILHFATLFEQAAQGTVCFNKNRKLTNYFELIEKYMLLYILFVFIRNFFWKKVNFAMFAPIQIWTCWIRNWTQIWHFIYKGSQSYEIFQQMWKK